MRKYYKGPLILGVCFSLLAVLLWESVSWRISQTYLEDDLVWFFPVIDHLLHVKNSAFALLKSFHLPELTLFDALYFTFLRFIFGYHFSLYPLASFLIHLVNGLLIFRILFRAFNCSFFTSSIAAFIYLSFYGHYHAYLWPMAMHHVLGVFWILVFIYEYVQIFNKEGMGVQGQDRKLSLNFRLYGLAFLASFMRLSVLIIPLMIGTHIVLTSGSKGDFYSKIRRWLPVFLIISWYQILILIVGKHGDVLSGFLNTESFILLCGLAVGLWFLFRKDLQRAYYCWLLIPFVFILCLNLWLFPQSTLTPSNVALRWQVMPLPAGSILWILFVILAWSIMYAFTRHALVRHKGFGLFIIWYILVFPYLASRLNAMPSRYLMYVSPIFAIVLAVSLGEILLSRVQTSYKNIFQVIIGCLLVGGIVANILAIHERSVRSFMADYHWKYDDILMAQYIKNDMTKRGIPFEEQTLCLQGVSRLRYLEDWAKTFLADHKIDGYESLRITLESVLGIRRENIKIEGTCDPAEIVYDFRDDSIFSGFKWPANVRKEDAWEIYGERFDGESGSLRIDNILQRQINFFDQGKTLWSLKQGTLVERYKGFDIYRFKNWYFAIPADELFNLTRFKMQGYQQQAYFGGTKYEIRQQIDLESGDRVEAKVVGALQRKPYYIPAGEHTFRMKFLGIPLGYLSLKNEGTSQRAGQEFCRVSAELKPWIWLQNISGNRVGFKMTSLVTVDDLLPVEFETIDLMKLRKGKQGRRIIYHHDDLFMERRGYKEDIDSDTRDLVAVILWAFAQDWAARTDYSTTLNIERSLFDLEMSPVSIENNKTLIKVRIKSLAKKGINYNGFMTLNYGAEAHIPESIMFNVGLANFSLISSQY